MKNILKIEKKNHVYLSFILFFEIIYVIYLFIYLFIYF